VVRKNLEYCIIVEFEDGQIKVFKNQEANDLYLHMDGNIVRIKNAKNEKIKHIIPLQSVALDRSGNIIYDCDIVKFANNTNRGIIQWRRGAYKIVSESGTEYVIDDIKDIERVENYYIETFKDLQKNIETAEVVQQ